MPSRVGSSSSSSSSSSSLASSDDKAKIDVLKVVGKLESVGFEMWNKNLKVVAMKCRWGMEWFKDRAAGVVWAPPARETREQETSRVDLFTLVYTSIAPKYSHLIENVELGDAQGAYLAVKARFIDDSALTFSALQKALNDSSMYKDHVTLEEYAALITRRAKAYREVGGNPSEAELVSLLLNGLLKEFDMKKTVICTNNIKSLKFDTVVRELISFGRHSHILEKKHGGGSHNPKTYFVEEGQTSSSETGTYHTDSNNNTHLTSPEGKKKPCHQFQKEGECRYRDKCRFSHSKKLLKCSFCKRNGHLEGSCYRKKGQGQEGGEKKQESREELVRNNKEALKRIIAEKRKVTHSFLYLCENNSTHTSTDTSTQFLPYGSDSEVYVTHSEVNPSKCEINATVSAKCYYTRGGDRSEWIADSGSNRFVTNDRKDFVFGSEKEIKERVKVGGGVVTVSVSGTVDLLDLSTLEMISLSNTNYTCLIVGESYCLQGGWIWQAMPLIRKMVCVRSLVLRGK